MSSNSPSIPTEFVAESFETEVTETEEDQLIAVIDEGVSNLRDQMDDETVENLLRAGAGSYLLRSSMTKDGLQPESFTQEAIINPLLDVMGHEYSIEAGGLSGGKTQVADYTISLRDHPEIDSARLLAEAEPINKDLDSRKHGIGQVRDWLSQREFESNFGFATDGLRWVFVRYDPDSYTHNIIEKVDLQPVFIALFENQVGERDHPSEVLFDEDKELVTRLIRTFEYENFVSIAGDAPQVIKQKREEVTDDFYDDYIRYVFGIVGKDEETARSLVGDGVVVPEGANEDESRLFAVELMNRLVFIKFLEDKVLVDPNLLQTLVDTYENGMYAGSFYESFLQPLFYDVMNQQPGTRPDHVENIDLFLDIPYLNGGLFRPTINGDDFDEEDFNVRNSVLFSIIDLLERYSFSAGGAPTDLDPSILGNVFEKTINYITSDNADKNKELGAYYTPSEITRFSAEETVRPALLDRFKDVLSEDRDWPEPEVEQYDTVFELIDDLPSSWSLTSDLLSEVDEFRVVDPACGSGHFLTSVLEEIVTIRKALYSQYEEEGEDTEPYPDEYKLKKTTVLNNIYGVDLMGPAVEIAKLRLWLSVISELETENISELAEDDALALPNIAFNLREGNSLIGYTGFPETNGDDQFRLGSFSEDSVRDRYQDIIDEIEKHEQAIESVTAEKHRLRAFKKLRNARDELIEDIHRDFKESGVGEITQQEVSEMEPFNWVLEFAEVYAEGGFDVVVGNPPWDRLKPLRDDFFSRYKASFRVLPPDEKNEVQEELLENEDISQKWEDYLDNMDKRATYFKNSSAYELQRPEIDGRVKPNPNDLSALFLERVFKIADDDSHIAQVLPGVVFNGASCKDLRSHILDNTRLKTLPIFENHGIFEQIDSRYKFGIPVFENQGSTDEVSGIYQKGNPDILQRIDEVAIDISKEVLETYSPEARIFPYIESEEKLNVIKKLIKKPPLGDESASNWHMEPYQGLRRTNVSDRFVDESEGDYPVYGGSNIYQFSYTPDFFENIDSPEFWSVDEESNPEKSAKHRMREKTIGDLKKAIYEKFDGTGSQKSFVNELLKDRRGKPLTENDVLLDSTAPRIVLRDITNSTNERTLISTVLPKGIVCHNSLRVVRNYEIEPFEEGLSEYPLHDFYNRIFTDEELFVGVGLLNSLPFDYLIRTKVDTHIVTYKFKETQMPHLSEGDDWFEYIWTRAARLNAYGDNFEELRDRLGGIEPVAIMGDRREVQAEIDAAAFHAYGLERKETKFVLDNFHRVQNPRLMDEDYFDMVLTKYDQLV